MKIVVNKGYGGFGISLLAIEFIANKKNIEKYIYHLMPRQGIWKRFEKIEDYFQGNSNDTVILSKNYGDEIDGITWAFKDQLTLHLKRTDLDLIEAVEQLGDKVNSSCAKLKAIEIPDDIEWEIDDYDGWETIHEKHRSW